MAGCYNRIRMPNFAHPGTAQQQRDDAERFDPYPDPQAGPEVVGGRPPGYTRPLSETEWGRRYAAPPGALQPLVLPSLPATAPVITMPYAPTAVPAQPGQGAPFQVQPRSPY
jgi:hypothetical protein